MRLVLKLQMRASFPQIYLGLAVVTVVVFRLVLPEQFRGWLLPALLLGEQGVVALTLVAAHVYLERNEGSVSALAVTPLSGGEYVAALVVGSSIFPSLSGALVWAGVLGVDVRALMILPPLFLLSALSGLLGVALAGRFYQFTAFLLGTPPAVGLIVLPALSYFEVVPRWAFVWLPSHWSLYGFAALTGSEPEWTSWLFSVVVPLLFCWAMFPWVSRVYRGRIRYRLDPVHE